MRRPRARGSVGKADVTNHRPDDGIGQCNWESACPAHKGQRNCEMPYDNPWLREDHDMDFQGVHGGHRQVRERKETRNLLQDCSVCAGLERDCQSRKDNETQTAGAEDGLCPAGSGNPALRRHFGMENHAAHGLHEEAQGQRQADCNDREEDGRDYVGVAHGATGL